MSYRPNPNLNSRETGLVVELMQSVAPTTVIEFGCNVGLTSRAILDDVSSIERYIGVDVPHHYKAVLPNQRDTPKTPGMYAASDPRFELMMRERGTLDLGPQDLPQCDAVFIDGDHSERVVRHDSNLARAVVQAGGSIIIWHDFHNRACQVTQVIHELADNGWPIEHIEGTWLVFCRV
jgi:hypothetical protein